MCAMVKQHTVGACIFGVLSGFILLPGQQSARIMAVGCAAQRMHAFNAATVLL
jgi:hypothetical protein